MGERGFGRDREEGERVEMMEEIERGDRRLVQILHTF